YAAWKLLDGTTGQSEVSTWHCVGACEQVAILLCQTVHEIESWSVVGADEEVDRIAQSSRADACQDGCGWVEAGCDACSNEVLSSSVHISATRSLVPDKTSRTSSSTQVVRETA